MTNTNKTYIKTKTTNHFHHKVDLTLEGLQITFCFDGIKLCHAADEVATVREDE